jgi:cytochrome c oxidase assembly protein subunit 15
VADTGRGLRAWATATTVGLFLVVLVGFFDTFTGSARGCGAMWPLCNGGVLPSPTVQSIIEYAHRALSGVVGLLVAVVTVAAWRRHPDRWEVAVLGAVGFGFVIVQAVVGALAVIWPEAPPVMALHFGFAILSFMGQALLTVVLWQLKQPTGGGWALRAHAPDRRVTVLALGVVVYALGLGYLGAYVAHAGAGLACRGWPLCDGRWIPPLGGLTLLAFAHRVAALGLAVLAVWLWAAVRPLGGRRPDLVRGVGATLVLVAAQIASGAYLVASRLSTGADMIHVALMTALFGVLGYVALQAVPRPAAAAGAGTTGGRAPNPRWGT